MYKIFVGNKPIVLTTELEPETNFKNFLIDSVDINKVLSKLKKDKYNSVRLVGADKDMLLKKFLSLLPNVIAAGGKVYNQKNEILFIFRNGKWDLPKGKVEKDETYQAAALRETQEETGVQDLELRKFIAKTYHVFKRNDKFKLKVTYWYEMYTNYKGDLKPQIEEDITKARWKNFAKSQKALTESYENIKLLFPKEYLTTHPNDRVS